MNCIFVTIHIQCGFSDITRITYNTIYLKLKSFAKNTRSEWLLGRWGPKRFLNCTNKIEVIWKTHKCKTICGEGVFLQSLIKQNTHLIVSEIPLTLPKSNPRSFLPKYGPPAVNGVTSTRHRGTKPGTQKQSLILPSWPPSNPWSSLTNFTLHHLFWPNPLSFISYHQPHDFTSLLHRFSIGALKPWSVLIQDLCKYSIFLEYSFPLSSPRQLLLIFPILVSSKNETKQKPLTIAPKTRTGPLLYGCITLCVFHS